MNPLLEILLILLELIWLGQMVWVLFNLVKKENGNGKVHSGRTGGSGADDEHPACGPAANDKTSDTRNPKLHSASR